MLSGFTRRISSVARNAHDGADDPAGGEHFGAGLQIRQHLRLLLLLLLHGHEDQEIENRNDGDQRQKAGNRIGRRGRD